MFFAVIPCLWRGQYFSSGKEPAEDNSVTPMLRHLIYKIKSTGPITVAEYMREVLTNPAKVWVEEARTRPVLEELWVVSQKGVRREEPRGPQPGGCLPGKEPFLDRVMHVSWSGLGQVSDSGFKEERINSKDAQETA